MHFTNSSSNPIEVDHSVHIPAATSQREACPPSTRRGRPQWSWARVCLGCTALYPSGDPLPSGSLCWPGHRVTPSLPTAALEYLQGGPTCARCQACRAQGLAGAGIPPQKG